MPSPAHAEPRFSTTRSLLYSAVVVLGFFAAVEAVLWWVDPAPPVRPRLILRAIDVDIQFPFMQPDPELFWAPQPGFEGRFQGRPVRINALGLRGPELAVPRPAKRRRLLTFGDSITFGYGVGDDETYAAVLGRLLDGRGYDVANAGVTGYTSHQVLGRLRRLSAVGADLATFCIGWNDGTLRPVEDRVYAQRLRTTQPLEGALGKWRLYRLLAGYYVRSRLRAEKQAGVRDERRVPLDRYRANLEQIAAECRRSGVQPVFVRLPHRRVPGQPRPASPYDDALVQAAPALGVPVLSAGVLGLDSGAEDTRAFFIDSLHLSPAGHALLAEIIERQLRELGLV